MPGNPVKLSAQEARAFTAPPLLGQHTQEVLRDVAGYDADRVATLAAAGVVA
jgi:crotonobetainyl-CoA:carnitine CoA-transferase CaiB-like acyl-CoA transferase